MNRERASALAERLAQFQDEAASYFENRPTNGEDQAHWSNVYNAENCRKTAAFLRSLTEQEGPLADDHPIVHCVKCGSWWPIGSKHEHATGCPSVGQEGESK